MPLRPLSSLSLEVLHLLKLMAHSAVPKHQKESKFAKGRVALHELSRLLQIAKSRGSHVAALIHSFFWFSSVSTHLALSNAHFFWTFRHKIRWCHMSKAGQNLANMFHCVGRWMYQCLGHIWMLTRKQPCQIFCQHSHIKHTLWITLVSSNRTKNWLLLTAYVLQLAAKATPQENVRAVDV